MLKDVRKLHWYLKHQACKNASDPSREELLQPLLKQQQPFADHLCSAKGSLELWLAAGSSPMLNATHVPLNATPFECSSPESKVKVKVKVKMEFTGLLSKLLQRGIQPCS